jgi:hypothetical protein
MNEARFTYATFKSLDDAENALFDMFASGDVFPSEKPRIEKRTTPKRQWVITLPM